MPYMSEIVWRMWNKYDGGKVSSDKSAWFWTKLELPNVKGPAMANAYMHAFDLNGYGFPNALRDDYFLAQNIDLRDNADRYYETYPDLKAWAEQSNVGIGTIFTRCYSTALAVAVRNPEVYFFHHHC